MPWLLSTMIIFKSLAIDDTYHMWYYVKQLMRSCKQDDHYAWRYPSINGARSSAGTVHDDVIKWKHFPRYWPFVRGIHRSPVNSPHKGQWRGALMFSLICVWINGWVNNREAGDLRRYRAHYDVTVMGKHKVASPVLDYSRCLFH